MKAIIEYNLPEDKAEFTAALNALELKYAIKDLDVLLRGYLKHGWKFETVEEAIQSIRDSINENRDLFEDE